MIKFARCFCALSAASILSISAANAGPDDFSTGPVFDDFGPNAEIDADFELADDVALKHSFDVKDQADAGALNRTLVSAARFINMHVRAGVDPDNIDVAVIVHGGAVKDVTNAAHYDSAVGGENANAALIAALTQKNVRIIVCGQSATYYEVDNDDLLPNVEMALSAMTAHALLQQSGYTINPF